MATEMFNRLEGHRQREKGTWTPFRVLKAAASSRLSLWRLTSGASLSIELHLHDSSNNQRSAIGLTLYWMLFQNATISFTVKCKGL